ncbi:hypothetical protein FACS1894184_17010 [Clostridia bacterium]|nr:hypothetical protein FACS1894184_17010 [Clostridia bacterium]
MHKLIGTRVRAWIVLATLVVMVVFAMALHNMIEKVNDELFIAKWEQERVALDILGDNIDIYVTKDQDWYEYDYSIIISEVIAKLDELHGVFAAAYDADMNIISNRTTAPDEFVFNPFVDQAFGDLVNAQMTGTMDVKNTFDPTGKDMLRMYFRWVPWGDHDNKMLLLIGLSWLELANSPANEMTAWYVSLLIISAIAVITAAFMLTQQSSDEQPDNPAALVIAPNPIKPVKTIGGA